MSTTALVDLDSLRPRATPSFLDTFRAYWEKRGVDGETGRLLTALGMCVCRRRGGGRQVRR